MKIHSLKQSYHKNQKQDNAKIVITNIHSNIVFFFSQLPCVCMTWVKKILNFLSSFLLPLTTEIYQASQTKPLLRPLYTKVYLVTHLLTGIKKKKPTAISIHLFLTHGYGSGWSKGSWIPSPSLSPIPPPPSAKSKLQWVRTDISYALLSAQKFSHYFTFWISRASPRNSFQMRRNSNFYLSFSHPSATSVLSGQKAGSKLPFQIYLDLSCLQEAVLALSTPEHRRRDPLPCPLQPWRGELLSCCNPAQEGDCMSLWAVWLKYQGYATADDGHKRGSLHQIQNKSSIPCKQRWGQVAKMCPFQPEHPLPWWSYRAGEIFASISLNNLHTAAIAYWYHTFIISLNLQLI